MTAKKPIVIIPANIVDYNGSPGHIVRDTYVRAVIEAAKAVPLIIPVTGADFSLDDIEDQIDGIMLTGSPSHVAPACYGEKQIFEDKELDTARDATTLPLIRQAIDRNIPVLAICRGFQELNVVTGGSLHQKVHELPGKLDHRPRKDWTLMEGYKKTVHKVITQKGGLFEKLGMPDEFPVNSVHQQGINRLGEGLHIEAVSEDGLIEAISIPGHRFFLGTQWHPEGDFDINQPSLKIFEAFGRAIRA